MKRIFYLSFLLYAVSVASGATTVSIEGTQWHINGGITYPGTAAEGLPVPVVQVDAALIEVVYRDDVEGAVAVQVTHRDARRPGDGAKGIATGKVASPIVEVDSTLLPAIPGDNVGIAIAVHIPHR